MKRKRLTKNQRTRRLGLRLLSHVQQKELDGLARFGQWRGRFLLADTASSGADLANEALLRLLRGLRKGNAGRHPRAKDVKSMAALLQFLRCVINSLIEGELRKHERKFPHQSLEVLMEEEELSVSAQVPTEGPDLFVFLDLKRELFKFLRQRAPQRLQKAISTWEAEAGQNFTIPLNGQHRRLRAQLRFWARKGLKALGENRR